MQTGRITAPNEDMAVAALHKNKFLIVSVEPIGGRFFGKQFQLLSRVSAKELVAFSRQLSTLFSAKVSLVSSLNSLARQTNNLYFRDAIIEIVNDVESGTSLSRALTKHPRIFSVFFVNLVRSGEVSGNLEKTLNYLADYIEKRYYLLSRIKSSMYYPVGILIVFISVFLLFIFKIFPQMRNLLEDAGSDQQWPLPTRIVFFITDIFQNWWWLMLAAIIFLIVGTILFYRTPRGEWLIDRIKLHLPIFGPIIQKFHLAQFTENFSTLIKGGVPILAALTLCAEVSGNALFRDVIERANERVKVGDSISSVFARSEVIPSMVTQMVFSGEQAGQLDFVLGKISTFYSQEVDRIVEGLTQLIEPILIVALAVMVGILVASVLLPMYNIIGTI